MQKDDDRIDEYLNTFMLWQLIKPSLRESWGLHCLRRYYRDQIAQYKQYCLGEEMRYPNLI